MHWTYASCSLDYNNVYAVIRSSTEHKLFMYLTSSIIIKRHKHQIFWDQLARRAANNRKSKQRRGNNVL